MCIALVKLPDANVSEDNLRACWQSNPDGAGFAYIKDGKVTIEKGFMTLKPFMEALNVALEANKESTFLIHFRIATHGDVNADNQLKAAVDMLKSWDIFKKNLVKN